jgi:hypothetical protein
MGGDRPAGFDGVEDIRLYEDCLALYVDTAGEFDRLAESLVELILLIIATANDGYWCHEACFSGRALYLNESLQKSRPSPIPNVQTGSRPGFTSTTQYAAAVMGVGANMYLASAQA